MDIDVFPAHELDTVFRVLRTALSPRPELEAREWQFLQTYARITGYTLAEQAPQPIAATEVRIGGAHQKKRLLQLAGIAVLFKYPVRPRSVEFLQALQAQLGVRDSVVGVAHALDYGHVFKARLLAARRAFRALTREAWLAGGAMGVLRFFGALFFGAAVGSGNVQNYKRLGQLPEGTLGRAYWRHLTAAGFGFPGERGGIPESAAYHDVAHVLAGHDTTPLGEIQQGSFQGGNRREDGFFFIQFAILQFHQGVRITPAAPAQVGYFDAEKVLWAIHRGANCNVDLTHQWDFWPLMEMPLEEARRRIGLLPHLEAVRTEGLVARAEAVKAVTRRSLPLPGPLARAGSAVIS